MITPRNDTSASANEFLTTHQEKDQFQPNTKKETALIGPNSKIFEVGFLVGLLAVMLISFLFYFAIPTLLLRL